MFPGQGAADRENLSYSEKSCKADFFLWKRLTYALFITAAFTGVEKPRKTEIRHKKRKPLGKSDINLKKVIWTETGKDIK